MEIGREAWRRPHPNQTAAYAATQAATQAVDVILAARVSLRVDDA
jgi:hypothetical protein